MFDYWDIESVIGCSVLVGLGAFIGLLMFAICQDHKPRFYYMSTHDGGVVCAVADVDWSDDITSYCSDDHDKVLAAVERLNATVKGK